MIDQPDGTLTDDELQTLQGLLARLGPGVNLPWPLFRFITEIAATPNIDLLVHDPARGVLLAWRDDPFGAGWHVPGSIIRHREEVAHRISACAQDEFGCAVQASARPVAVIQIFDDRGHSVSLCYTAALMGSPGKRVVEAEDSPVGGDLCWFAALPRNLYPSHRVYRDVVQALDRGDLGQGAALFTQHAGQREAAHRSPGGRIDADAPLA